MQALSITSYPYVLLCVSPACALLAFALLKPSKSRRRHCWPLLFRQKSSLMLIRCGLPWESVGITSRPLLTQEMSMILHTLWASCLCFLTVCFRKCWFLTCPSWYLIMTHRCLKSVGGNLGFLIHWRRKTKYSCLTELRPGVFVYFFFLNEFSLLL